MGLYWKELESSAYPRFHKISIKLTPYISALGSLYLLRQMNYSTLSYRFIPICSLPFLAYKPINLGN